VIAHVVLFRPKPSMTVDQRATMVDALRRAVDGIPEIKRFTIGKRILLNRPGYETQMAEHYEYSAILEFDSESDLRAYLDHPSHSELGKMLFTSAEAVLAYDFASVAKDDLSKLIG
jgi:Stress responsive A/B Barrel Domain